MDGRPSSSPIWSARDHRQRHRLVDVANAGAALIWLAAGALSDDVEITAAPSWHRRRPEGFRVALSCS
jgi:hypothetical protein